MKLKLTEDGSAAVLNDAGLPILVRDDGTEDPLNFPELIGKVKTLSAERDTHRKAHQQAAEKAKLLEEIENPAEWLADARKALDQVKNFKDSDFVKAEKVEQLKAEWQKASEARVGEIEKALEAERAKAEELTGKLHDGIKSRAFLGSEFIKEKLAIPADIAMAAFGQHFRVESDRLLAYENGKESIPIHSRDPNRLGEPAEFDEALAILVDRYPHKDHILLGTQSSGSGGPGRTTRAQTGEKKISREEYDGLGPLEQAAKLREGFTVS